MANYKFTDEEVDNRFALCEALISTSFNIPLHLWREVTFFKYLLIYILKYRLQVPDHPLANRLGMYHSSRTFTIVREKFEFYQKVYPELSDTMEVITHALKDKYPLKLKNETH